MRASYLATCFALVSLGLGLGMSLGLPTAVQAKDDGQEGLLDSLLGAAGLGDKREPEIDYRDQPPLVLPPKMLLRQPLAARQRTAAWPQDPDVVRRAKESAEDGMPVKDNSQRATGRPLTKQELLAGRANANGAPTTPNTGPGSSSCVGSRSRDCHWVRPDILQSQGVLTNQGTTAVAVGTEPDRRYLTEPPVGYRKMTKEVKVRQSAPIEKEDSSPLSFFKKRNPWDKEED